MHTKIKWLGIIVIKKKASNSPYERHSLPHPHKAWDLAHDTHVLRIHHGKPLHLRSRRNTS